MTQPGTKKTRMANRNPSLESELRNSNKKRFSAVYLKLTGNIDVELLVYGKHVVKEQTHRGKHKAVEYCGSRKSHRKGWVVPMPEHRV